MMVCQQFGAADGQYTPTVHTCQYSKERKKKKEKKKGKKKDFFWGVKMQGVVERFVAESRHASTSWHPPILANPPWQPLPQSRTGVLSSPWVSASLQDP